MSYPYAQVSIVGQGLESFGFVELNQTDWLATLTDGFVTSLLFTTPWCPALSEGASLTSWVAALSEGTTLTTWSLAASEIGATMTSWIDAISEVPPTGGTC